MLAQKFLKYEVKKVPVSVKKLIAKSELEKILLKQIERRLNFLNDRQRAGDFMKIVNHNHSDIEDYFFHLIDCGNDNFLVTTIDFQDINPARGIYVTVVLKNFDLQNIGNLEKILNIIRDRYKMFSPEWMEFFETGKIVSGNRIKCTDYFVTGHIDTIKMKDKPDRYNEITLEKVTDLKFYKRYYDEYKKLKVENKMFEAERIETKESFEMCLSGGYVHKIIIDRKFAGVHALLKREMKFCKGYYVIEKVMFEKFRRKNFTAAVQRKVIDSLPAGGNEFIFGNISPDNYASLKTALKSGRFIAGTYLKINFKKKFYENFKRKAI